MKGCLMLDRDDVYHDASPTLDHARDDRTIKTHRRKQIQIKRLYPVIIAKRMEAAARFMRASNAVYQNFDAAPFGQKPIDNRARAASRANVALHEELRSLAMR